ncbi:ribbon-helix-helix protein, CopG family [bacterium]|nr:ribbon-helix-helix protein, CopG family [bacterium]
MASEHLSLRISKETKAQLEKLAKATGRSTSFIAKDAIDRYLDLEAWQIMAVQEGLRDYENGNVVPLEDFEKEWGITHNDL